MHGCTGTQRLTFWSPEWEQRQKFLAVLSPVESIVKTIERSCQNSKQALPRGPSTGNRHTGECVEEQEHSCGLEREGASMDPILQHSHLCYAGAMWGYVPSCILDPLGSPHPNPCLIPVRLYPPPHNYLLLLIQTLCPGLLGSDQCLRSHTANCILGHQSHVYNSGPLDLAPQ